MILLGTGLLMLPISSVSPASFGDALFTATSASCVTGLVQQDTGTYWTTFGQLVIITLIQIGGLGFMTIATLFLLLLRRRMGLRQREVVVEGISYNQLGGFAPFIRRVLLGTLLMEGLGAARTLESFAFFRRFIVILFPASFSHSAARRGAYIIWVSIIWASIFCSSLLSRSRFSLPTHPTRR